MLYLRTLGTARIEARATQFTPTSLRTFALLLYLSAERGRRVSKAALHDLIFPDQTERNARHSLREIVYRCRQAGIPIGSDASGIELAAEAVRSDYSEVIERDRPDAAQVEAVAGGFLPGYAPGHSEAYAEWYEGYRAKVVFEVCKALLREVQRTKRAGEWQKTEAAARACLVLDPLNEEATLVLAEMLAIGGAKAQAVELLDAYAEEVGGGASALSLPATVLSRRIRERAQHEYCRPPLTPFVARTEEILKLSQCGERARDGAIQCVVITGEPGIGKSRLAQEFEAITRLGEWRTAKVSARAHDRIRPMSFFAELVPQLISLPGALGASPSALKAVRKLTEFDVDSSGELVAEAESERRSAAITNAVADILDAVADEHPIIIVGEDLHWTDGRSFSVLVDLLANARRRLLVVVTSRDAADFGRFGQLSSSATHIALERLSPKEVYTFIRGCSSERTVDDSLASWMEKTSDGNPFVLQSLVSHFSSTGERFVVPSSTQDLIEQRLQPIRGVARRFLECCVFLGRFATLDRLLRLLELPLSDVLQALTELEERRILREDAGIVGPSHWLLAETVLRTATPVARKAAHFGIAQMLENELHTTPDATTLWACADHWQSAGEDVRAARTFEACARHSIAIGRPREAAELLLKAASISSGPQRSSLASRGVTIAHEASERDVVVNGLTLMDNGALDNVGSQHDDVEMAQLMTAGFRLHPDHRVKTRLWRCLSANNATVAHRLEAGFGLLVLADYYRNSSLAQKAFDAVHPLLLIDSGDSERLALCCCLLFHSTFGDHVRALSAADGLSALASHTESPDAPQLRFIAAGGFWRIGHARRAVSELEAGYASAERAGLIRTQFRLAISLSWFNFDLERVSDGHSWLTRADDLVRGNASVPVGIDYLINRAELALLLDEYTRLEALLRAVSAQGFAPNIRTRVWESAMNVALRTHRGENIAAEDVAYLTANQIPNFEFGDCADSATSVAAMVVRKQEGNPAAARIIHRYLAKYRRPSTPISALLRREMNRAGFAYPLVQQEHYSD